MSGAGARGATRSRAGRVDGRILVSNLLSGACFLAVLVPFSWPLALMGAVYVAVAAVFLAAVYAHPALTRRQEAAAWVAPWVAAVALWTWIAASAGGSSPTWFLHVWFGVVIATPCYVGWQAGALAVRQLLAWRATSRPV